MIVDREKTIMTGTKATQKNHQVRLYSFVKELRVLVP